MIKRLRKRFPCAQIARNSFVNVVLFSQSAVVICARLAESVEVGDAMKRGKLLNGELSYTVATIGHGQSLTIADAGLPIPSEPKAIDLAVTEGIPGFMPVLEAVLAEMKVESVIIAKEFSQQSPRLYGEFMAAIASQSERDGREIEVIELAHEAFKAETCSSQAVVRTGEFTPYANVILRSGVVF